MSTSPTGSSTPAELSQPIPRTNPTPQPEFEPKFEPMTNDALVAETAALARAFLSGQVALEDVQSNLQAVSPLLERVGHVCAVLEALTAAEAELETITFTLFGDEVQPAAEAAVRELLVVLDGRP